MTDEERLAAGLKVRRAGLGDDYVNKSMAAADDFTRPLQELVSKYCWGDVWCRPGLDRKQRARSSISRWIATLNRPHELKAACARRAQQRPHPRRNPQKSSCRSRFTPACPRRSTPSEWRKKCSRKWIRPRPREAARFRLSRAHDGQGSSRASQPERECARACGRTIARADDEFPLCAARRADRHQQCRRTRRHRRQGRANSHRRLHAAADARILARYRRALPIDGGGDPSYRPPANAQSRHHRRQPRSCRSRCGIGRGGNGTRTRSWKCRAQCAACAAHLPAFHADFFLGPYSMTTRRLEPDEMLSAIVIFRFGRQAPWLRLHRITAPPPRRFRDCRRRRVLIGALTIAATDAVDRASLTVAWFAMGPTRPCAFPPPKRPLRGQSIKGLDTPRTHRRTHDRHRAPSPARSRRPRNTVHAPRRELSSASAPAF